jgi:hypothetical protein
MPTEPGIKRAFAFFDGQNLFYAAKEAFGYPFPNYDPRLLTEMAVMGTRGIQTFSRSLRYRNQTVALPSWGRRKASMFASPWILIGSREGSSSL